MRDALRKLPGNEIVFPNAKSFAGEVQFGKRQGQPAREGSLLSPLRQPGRKNPNCVFLG